MTEYVSTKTDKTTLIKLTTKDTLKSGLIPASKVISTKNNITQIFATFTVGLTTIGAVFAGFQLYKGSVGLLGLTLLVIFYFLTALGIEAGFHRYFSHSSFKGRAFTTWMLGILGSMAAQGPVIFWVATHRKHHAFTDVEGDPHSPLTHGKNAIGMIKGFIHSHIGWLFESNPTSWAKFAPDLLRRREVIAINQTYLLWVILGLVLPGLIGGIIGGTLQSAIEGLVWGGLLRIFLLDHMTWSVNSICHLIGKAPYSTKNNSRNLVLLSIPSVGGSLHNNHHYYPVSARNDHQSLLQLDLSGLFIEMLGIIGLASDIKRCKK